MITWYRELLFECDQIEHYNPDCVQYLALDQLDARTKRGMLSIAKKLGWTWNSEECFCPACSKKYNKSFHGMNP